LDFICNICGAVNTGVESFGREEENCSGCRSSVRMRSVIYALSRELFGTPLKLCDFPVLKGIRGLGMTDCESYARVLREKFSYENTFFDAPPKLDITDLDGREEGAYDFLISSEVFEHVCPPWENALKNALRLLKPHGVLIMTVPYSLLDHAVEHFEQLSDYGLVQLRGGHVLVNRTPEGELQVFDKLVFHGGPGSTLEMRVLNDAELKRGLLSAGFNEVQFYGDNYGPFGIFHQDPWSLPLAARKQPFTFTEPVRMELMKQFGKNHEDLRRHVAQNISLLKELEERAEWGVRLDQNMAEARGIIERLDAELEKRTEWALSLDKTVEERTEWAKSLEAEVENRTKWARDLERELNECRRRIAEIESKRRMRQRLKKVVKRVVRRDS
jgi:SAM-dependent methyltransferase